MEFTFYIPTFWAGFASGAFVAVLAAVGLLIYAAKRFGKPKVASKE